MRLQNPQGCGRQARLHTPSLVVFFVYVTMPMQNSQGCDRETRLHPLCALTLRGQPCCHFRHTIFYFAKNTTRLGWVLTLRNQPSRHFCHANLYFAKNTTRLGGRLQLGQLSGASLVVIFEIRILNLQKTQQGWRVRLLTGRLSGGKDVYS